MTKIIDISESHANAKIAVEHAINALNAILKKPRFSINPGESKIYLELRRDLPYAVHSLSFKEAKILLNRNYKPLGNPSKTGKNWVDYEKFNNMHIKLTAEQIFSIVPFESEVRFFGDNNSPWISRVHASNYIVRLEKLFMLL